MNRRVLLVVLDGFGIAPAGKGNAISLAKKPNFDFLWTKYPHVLLEASGEAVGLPKNQIGNSEVGHLNMGAGRVVQEDLPRISNSIKNGNFFENKVFLDAFEYAKKNNKKVHLIGLVSPGGVHSHQEHLYALLSMARHCQVHDVYIHAFTDGRDVAPSSAISYIEKLEDKIKKIGVGKIATIIGRYFAMDRDNRWDRIQLAYKAMVLGRGESFHDPIEAIKKSYQRGISDEFIRPLIIDTDGLINDEEVVIFFNLRSDRPRELTKAFIDKKFNDFKREKDLKNLYFVTMTDYNPALKVNGVAFPQIEIKNCLAEVLSKHTLRQFHIAESEKYAHVTFYFNGGVEIKFAGEDRLLIPSPKVASYDKKPEMSASKIAAEVVERLGRYDFILVNFANLDMVGHTGNIGATIKAVESVDSCLGGLVTAAQESGYNIIVTADHGNAEKMINSDGTPHTAHTTNKVPFILVTENHKILRKIKNFNLGCISPTILKLMGVEKPIEMTDESLV